MSIDPTILRTHDPRLRRLRWEELVRGALAASKAARACGLEVLVTGSLSRGQTHPWSDLDLLLRAPEGVEASYDARRGIGRAIEARDLYAYDLVPEAGIIPALRKGMVEGAISLDALPELGELPDADLAPLRAAQSLEFTVEHVRRSIAEEAEHAEEDPENARIYKSYGVRIGRSQLQGKAELALKRLAVFQDGGRSSFLDGDHSEATVSDLLQRLSSPASEPFERPAMLPPEVVPHLLWLIGGDSLDDTDVEKRLADALDAIEAWVPLLRSTTDRTEMHGLPESKEADGSLQPAP